MGTQALDKTEEPSGPALLKPLLWREAGRDGWLGDPLTRIRKPQVSPGYVADLLQHLWDRHPRFPTLEIDKEALSPSPDWVLGDEWAQGLV